MLKAKKIPVAAKTGTTDSIVDRWFCGYTPYYAAATWYGFDNRLKTTEISEADNGNVVHIWQDVMKRIHSDKPPKDWIRPDNIVEHSISTLTGKLPSEVEVENNYVEKEYFVKDSPLEPKTVSSEEDLEQYYDDKEKAYPGDYWKLEDDDDENASDQDGDKDKRENQDDNDGKTDDNRSERKHRSRRRPLLRRHRSEEEPDSTDRDEQNSASTDSSDNSNRANNSDASRRAGRSNGSGRPAPDTADRSNR